jgi:aldose 1-epimerase
MEVTNYGATLMRLQVPNAKGKLIDVVVGLPKAEDYASKKYQALQFCLGATIGRYAGRISSGGFRLNDNFYALEDDITLHGGRNSFDKQWWKVEEINKSETPFVLFSLESKADNNGFPGNLKVFAKFQLIENSLRIRYSATTDSPTVINLTNHSYFNLEGKGSVKANTLYVNSDQLLETDERLVPTGRFLTVKDTPFDYKNPKPLHFDGHYGLDTPFVLNKGDVKASLFSETSGIEMQVMTNQPAMVLFTPQDLPEMGLRDNDTFTQYPAICFECQNFPDAPNQPHFLSSVLLPGKTYVNEIGYSFTTS